METITTFENISNHIIQHLKGAKADVYVCVAWLTDEEILNTLISKAREKVSINIITLNDEYNRSKNHFFNQLTAYGSKVFLIDKSAENGMIHHKFCVIDNYILITGSYNWTNNAKHNSENIIINVAKDFEDYSVISKYINEFDKVLYKYGILDEKIEWGNAFSDFETRIKEDDKLFNEAKEYYEISLTYWKEGQIKGAIEFINEAIGKYKHKEFYLHRHILYLRNNNILDSSTDLFLYMDEIACNNLDDINSFREQYEQFIDYVKTDFFSYKFISDINTKTKAHLGTFANLEIEPHFFTYDELKPLPF